MIQRFTGDPINVPIRFFDNLNFAIFQEVVEAPVVESRDVSPVLTKSLVQQAQRWCLDKGMFEWDPKHKHFRGMFQPHLMEKKLLLKWDSKIREVYDELTRRAEAIQVMADRDLTHYDDVFDLLNLYYNGGWDAFRSADTWVSITER